ncbi:hypothetical protein Tco_1259311 [Tanacetum coccineum]
MPVQRSNEDQAVRISKSIFVTNFPDNLGSKYPTSCCFGLEKQFAKIGALKSDVEFRYECKVVVFPRQFFSDNVDECNVDGHCKETDKHQSGGSVWFDILLNKLPANALWCLLMEKTGDMHWVDAKVLAQEEKGVVKELKIRLQDIKLLEVKDLVQKSKIKWAIEGDENSKFFHGIINKKRSQLSIRGVFVEGTWYTDPSIVKEAFKI